MQSDLKWISSQGGPLILMEKRLVSNWWGSVNRASNEWTAVKDQLTDYDRACAIEDYLGCIDIGPGKGLVLDDEPMQTTWLPFPKEQGGMFVRWQWAPDEASVIKTLGELQEELWHSTNLSFWVNDGVLLLFDAACPGSDIDSSLTIELVAGRYFIDSAAAQPDEETSLILHRLRPTAIGATD
jgi:hypothetical protein